LYRYASETVKKLQLQIKTTGIILNNTMQSEKNYIVNVGNKMSNSHSRAHGTG